MRYAILASALAANAYAIPILDIVTKVVIDKNVVTVTADAPAAAPTVEDVVTVTATATATATSTANGPTIKNNVAAVGSGNWLEQLFGYTLYNPFAAPSSTSTPTPTPTPEPTIEVTPTPTPEVTPTPTPEPTPEPEPTTTRRTRPASTKSQSKPSAEAHAASNNGGFNFVDTVLLHHNIHRKNHSAPDIEWDEGLAATAKKIANLCIYEHNLDIDKDQGGYGQNIAAGSPPNQISAVITDMFYNSEEPNFAPFYGQATPSDMSTPTFDSFGHFTQVVWKGSTKVGCAVVDCTGSGKGPNGLASVDPLVRPFFTVCNYGPPGNYVGEFDKNVGRPLGQPFVNGKYGL